MTDTPQSESTPTPPPPAPSKGSDKTVMLVLAYVWILALVPLLVEKEDSEVQWHAKNGLCLLVAEIILWIVLTIIGMIPVLNLVGCVLGPAAFLGILIVRIMAIVKATKGERFIIPAVSEYADRF